MAHYAFMRELTANNFFLRNCVDLKLASIIRSMFQFGFRIVWDSDPSGFGILNCLSLVRSYVHCFDVLALSKNYCFFEFGKLLSEFT